MDSRKALSLKEMSPTAWLPGDAARLPISHQRQRADRYGRKGSPKQAVVVLRRIIIAIYEI